MGPAQMRQWPRDEKGTKMSWFEAKPYRLNDFMSPSGIEILTVSMEFVQKLLSDMGNSAGAKQAKKVVRRIRGGALSESDVDFIIQQSSVLSLATRGASRSNGGSMDDEQVMVIAATFGAIAEVLKERKAA